MTAANQSTSEYATRANLDLLRRDVQHTEELLRREIELLRRDIQLFEERLQGRMYQLENRLMRCWTIGAMLAGMGIAAAIAAAIVQVVG